MSAGHSRSPAPSNAPGSSARGGTTRTTTTTRGDHTDARDEERSTTRSNSSSEPHPLTRRAVPMTATATATTLTNGMTHHHSHTHDPRETREAILRALAAAQSPDPTADRGRRVNGTSTPPASMTAHHSHTSDLDMRHRQFRPSHGSQRLRADESFLVPPGLTSDSEEGEESGEDIYFRAMRARQEQLRREQEEDAARSRRSGTPGPPNA